MKRFSKFNHVPFSHTLMFACLWLKCCSRCKRKHSISGHGCKILLSPKLRPRSCACALMNIHQSNFEPFSIDLPPEQLNHACHFFKIVTQYFPRRQGLLMRGNVFRARYSLLVISEHSRPKSFCGAEMFCKWKIRLTCHNWSALFQEFLDRVKGLRYTF